MKSFARALWLALTVATLGWIWWTFFPSPERVIAGRFRKMANAASVHAGEGYVPRLVAAQSIGGFFAPTVELSLDVPGHREHNAINRDDLVQALMGVQLSAGLSVRISDIHIVIAADGNTAQADMTVQGKLGGDGDTNVQEMRFSLRKIDGQWLITRAQTVRTFSENRPRLFPGSSYVKQNPQPAVPGQCPTLIL